MEYAKLIIETAKSSGVDHVASIFIVIQLGVVGSGIAVHRGAHIAVYLRHRIFGRRKEVVAKPRVAYRPPPIERHYSRPRLPR